MKPPGCKLTAIHCDLLNILNFVYIYNDRVTEAVDVVKSCNPL